MAYPKRDYFTFKKYKNINALQLHAYNEAVNSILICLPKALAARSRVHNVTEALSGSSSHFKQQLTRRVTLPSVRVLFSTLKWGFHV